MIAAGYYPTCEDIYDAALWAESDLIRQESEFKKNQNRHVTTETAKLPRPPHTTFKRRGVSFFRNMFPTSPKLVIIVIMYIQVNVSGRVKLDSVVDSLGIK
ncbi:hypothetical protein ACH5RR_001018 [Cinchona calisaya]|uniref:Uncharacterized protein n=1 Tax=Cinchona calisaya TaxID=153742 RepID=A0ABD3B280_9GENT